MESDQKSKLYDDISDMVTSIENSRLYPCLRISDYHNKIFNSEYRIVRSTREIKNMVRELKSWLGNVHRESN